MAFLCMICPNSHEFLDEHLKHLRDVHHLKLLNNSMKCIMCNKTYANYNSYRRHLSKNHTINTSRNVVLPRGNQLPVHNDVLNNEQVQMEDFSIAIYDDLLDLTAIDLGESIDNANAFHLPNSNVFGRPALEISKFIQENLILKWLFYLCQYSTTVKTAVEAIDMWCKDIQFGPVIFLQLYADELGTTNPLRASSAKTYKIIACYFRILNLPMDVQAYLKHIFCYFIAQSKHMENNYQECFDKLLLELRELERTGIHIVYRGRKLLAKVILLNFSGDNKRIHEFIGWTLSWRGNAICRMCGMNYEEITTKSDLTNAILRTKEQYDRVIIDQEQWQQYGIKSKCSINKLQHYHCMEPISVDITHDLFEGHLQYFIPWVFQGLRRQIPSIHNEMIEIAIAEFPYAALDARNKPLDKIKFSRDREGNLQLKPTAHAMQILTLLLPLILKAQNIVPNCQEWKDYLRFRKLLDIFLAPAITEKDIETAEMLISEHLHAYINNEAMPGWMTIKPHNMLHYPAYMMESGPLIHGATVRYEGRHADFKKISHNNCNHINIAKSLMHRNQLALAGTLWQMKKDDYFETCREEHYKARYLRGLMVVHAISNEIPQFGKIMKLEKNVLHFQNYKTIEFEENTHSFVVEETADFNQTTIEQLKCHRPLSLYHFDKLYIVLPYKLLMIFFSSMGKIICNVLYMDEQLLEANGNIQLEEVEFEQQLKIEEVAAIMKERYAIPDGIRIQVKMRVSDGDGHYRREYQHVKSRVIDGCTYDLCYDDLRHGLDDENEQSSVEQSPASTACSTAMSPSNFDVNIIGNMNSMKKAYLIDQQQQLVFEKMLKAETISIGGINVQEWLKNHAEHQALLVKLSENTEVQPLMFKVYLQGAKALITDFLMQSPGRGYSRSKLVFDEMVKYLLEITKNDIWKDVSSSKHRKNIYDARSARFRRRNTFALDDGTPKRKQLHVDAPKAILDGEIDDIAACVAKTIDQHVDSAMKETSIKRAMWMETLSNEHEDVHELMDVLSAKFPCIRKNIKLVRLFQPRYEPNSNTDDDMMYNAMMSLFPLIRQFTNRVINNDSKDVFLEEKGIGSLNALMSKKKAKNQAQPMILIMDTTEGRKYAIALHEAYLVDGTMEDAMTCLLDMHYVLSIAYKNATNFYYLLEQLAGITKIPITTKRNTICDELSKIAREKGNTPQYDTFREEPYSNSDD
uniref:C2H2-type domain-containing protein n=1 Tax=Panagrolaimus sp. JU765 TaxID=591449 RepID=A0AC34QUW4_9BILA